VSDRALRVRRVGSVPYPEALDLQRSLARRADDDYLLVLEHPHVYTLGVRADPAHVLVDPAEVGATLVVTDRGGDVTYHGPGQLVVYPILTVDDDPGAGRRHVHQLEQVVIDALTDLGAARAGAVGRLPGYPGIWVGVDGPKPRKVAAVGVRTVRQERPAGTVSTRWGSRRGELEVRRRTLHGVAINVDCDLSMFEHIVPCGIGHLPVTSLHAEAIPGGLEEVAEAIILRAALQWAPGGRVDRQDVTAALASSPIEPTQTDVTPIEPTQSQPTSATRRPVPVRLSSAEPAAVRRLRRAGVDPHEAVPLRSPKPSWLRVPARMGTDYLQLGRTVHGLGLNTVCEEAGCPNIFDCWSEGTATFMINGTRCTRACGFCKVDTRRPLPLDPSEPDRVGAAVARMGLAHAVVTCVARDDLDDGGAGAMADTVRAIRRHSPGARVEVLISDCKGDERALATIFESSPDVMNHNIETVARLQRAVRPSAGYARSLAVLARATEAGLVTKSGLMVGLGERREEVLSTFADLAGVGVSIATVGQYLRPSADHLPVMRWWSPEEFDELGSAGRTLGLAHVESSPLTRSSYHAHSAAEALEAAR
jgi:lipoyl synthase